MKWMRVAVQQPVSAFFVCVDVLWLLAKTKVVWVALLSATNPTYVCFWASWICQQWWQKSSLCQFWPCLDLRLLLDRWKFHGSIQGQKWVRQWHFPNPPGTRNKSAHLNKESWENEVPRHNHLRQHLQFCLRRHYTSYDFWAAGVNLGWCPEVWPQAFFCKHIDSAKNGSLTGIRKRLRSNLRRESTKHYRDKVLEYRPDNISEFRSRKRSPLVRHKHIGYVPHLDCIGREMSLCRVLECTIRNIVPSQANNFDYSLGCIRTHHGTIFPSIFQRPLIDQADTVLDCRPWKQLEIVTNCLFIAMTLPPWPCAWIPLHNG